MDRVPYDRLDYPGEDGLHYYRGKPFTGISYQERNAVLASEQEYRQGLAWGRGRTWFPSGAVASEHHSVEGVFEGLRRVWYENGSLMSEEMFEFGICVWRKRWDEEGELIEDYQLKKSDADYKTLQLFRSASREEGQIQPESPVRGTKDLTQIRRGRKGRRSQKKRNKGSLREGEPGEGG